LASLVALQSTKIPKVDMCVEDDFTISGDLSEATKLDVSNLPTIISISKVGSCRLFDVSNDERLCSSYSISIAINRCGACCGILKHLCGSINNEELSNALKETNIASQSIFNKIDEYYDSLELINSSNFSDIPNLRIGLLR
jgi:exosome complex component RRP42